jgi:Mce-associated membrane protein
MPTSTTSTTHRAPPRRRIAGDRLRRELEVDPELEPHLVIQLPADDEHEKPEKAEKTEILSSADPVTEPDEALEDGSPTSADDSAQAGATDVRRRQRWVTPVLAACLVAVLAACALAAVTTRNDRADISAGDAALGVATASATKILSYDYRHLPADFAAATATTTGSFRTDYQATTSKAVQQLATQTHAVVVAKVVAGGVVSSTSSRATVLLFVNQTTTSNRLSAAKTDLNRVQLTLSKVDGHWLVSALSAL